jgi:tungstate transport system substrate-binding protein
VKETKKMRKMDNKAISKLTLTVILVVTVAVASIAGVTYILAVGKKQKLVVSTTTSLYDTGLLDVIEEQFEAKYAIDVYFISVGTGLAIQHAQRGDADMILVHSPSQELAFLEDGYGMCRKIVAYNFFAIIGPQEDPAQIGDLSPLEALTKIVEEGRDGNIVWVSRGDDSGTHTAEKGLWTAAGFDWTTLRNEDWYQEAGTGMGGTLLLADEFSAYTLADMGTYLKYYNDGLINLAVLVSQGEELLNVYSAIAVNKTQNAEANFEGAITFIKFLISQQGQQIIAEYGNTTYGQPLFYPTVQLLNENTDPTIVSWIQNYAYFDGTECPEQYRDNNHPELYD